MGKARHELKYTRKTGTHWCTCRNWQMKTPLVPWAGEPEPELAAKIEHVVEEFDRHVKESEREV